MTIRRIVLLIAGFFVLSAPIAAAAIPGPQRMLAPGWYGMTEIAPGIFSDDPYHAESQLRMLASANARVRGFFGELKAGPRAILCTTMMCERTFGGSGNVAIAYGWSAIRIPPKAFREPELGIVLMAHERTHIELHRQWATRISALWSPPQPNWFDEGLASFVSRDYRLPKAFSTESKAWIRNSQTFWDWGRYVGERGWREAYGAAAANVSDLHARMGRDGLLRLIGESVRSGGFNALAVLDPA